MTPSERAQWLALREQRALALLGAWADRGLAMSNEWVVTTAAAKTRELVPGHAELDEPITAREAARVLTAAYRHHRDARLREAFERDQRGEAC